MFRRSLLSLGLLSALGASSASAHHAACVTGKDTFMVCGTHAGRISFELQKFGPVTEDSTQLMLCNNRGAKVEKMVFNWVESEDSSTHFPMEDVKVHEVSENCSLLGGLDFTPPADFQGAEQNAWRLDIFVEGLDMPSSVYVEAIGK